MKILKAENWKVTQLPITACSFLEILLKILKIDVKTILELEWEEAVAVEDRNDVNKLHIEKKKKEATDWKMQPLKSLIGKVSLDKDETDDK